MSLLGSNVIGGNVFVCNAIVVMYVKCSALDDARLMFDEINSYQAVLIGKNSLSANDHYCWMRSEDMDYAQPVHECHSCSDLAAEMVAAFASASIVFTDNKAYSQKLVRGARTLFKFFRDQQGRYSARDADASIFYNFTNYYDEYVWGAAWLYYATGNSS
ncbi:unnamed protein product [Ilex paraguariensis]|uniref:cellulase n=1 Tax=Ilex paraguariensis TaxID=185542 RepID=A0ABC8TH98_9AQUA